MKPEVVVDLNFDKHEMLLFLGNVFLLHFMYLELYV